MQLTKLPYSVSNPIAHMAPPSRTSLDTSVEPSTAAFFWIQTVTSPLKCILTQNFVGTGIGQPQAMTPQPQNHDLGTYYSSQGALLYSLLNFRRPLRYLLQRRSMFLHHSH